MLIFAIVFCSMISLFFCVGYRFKWLTVWLLLAAGICFPCFAKTKGWDWFRFAKTYSVLFPIFFYALSQAIHESRKNLPSRGFKNSFLNSYFCSGFLKAMICLMPFAYIINIFEANVASYISKEFINLIAGTVLILTIPNFWGKWRFNRWSLLGFGSYPDWCIVYTLWNAYFVQNYTNGKIQESFPLMLILLLSLFVCILCKDWHIWIYCRAYSLGFVLIATGFFPGFTDQFMSYLPDSYWVLSAKSLTFWSCINLLASFYLLYRTIKEKRSCLIRI